VQQFLLDNLGRAIDRLIERCVLLDKDRTALGHALARVQQELLRVRASHLELEQRCRHLEARQEEAALRLEKLLAAMPDLGGGAEEGGAAESAAEEAHAVPSPGAHANPVDTQETNAPLPLEQSTVKPFDIGSLQRIARLAADSAQGKKAKPAGKAKDKELSDTQGANAALDSTAAGQQDRLF